MNLSVDFYNSLTRVGKTPVILVYSIRENTYFHSDCGRSGITNNYPLENQVVEYVKFSKCPEPLDVTEVT